MNEGREESEWNRLSTFMAFIGNRLRFSKDSPVFYPKDLNPYCKNLPSVRKDAKERMGDMFARCKDWPSRVMKLVDGKWIEVGVKGLV